MVYVLSDSTNLYNLLKSQIGGWLGGARGEGVEGEDVSGSEKVAAKEDGTSSSSASSLWWWFHKSTHYLKLENCLCHTHTHVRMPFVANMV